MAATVSTPASSTAQDASTITISSYTVPAGAGKILTVEISLEDFEGGALAVVDSVTHDAVNLTQRKRHTSGGTTGNISEIWDLQLGSSTPSGDIVVTLDSQVTTLIAGALTAIAVAQQAPEATASQNLTASPINTAITTITDGALIIDCLSAGQDNAVAITQGPDQVEDIEVLFDTAALAVSHRIGGSAGAHTLGWSQITATNRLVHTLVAYKEAAAGASIAITAARLAFGRPVAFADAVLNKRAFLDFGRPVAFATNVLMKRGTFLSGRPAIFTHVINIGKGLLNLAGQNILLRGGVQIGKAVLNFSRPVTFTFVAIAKAYRLSIGRGVSFLKGVGFKKVGEEDVSTITNPEDQ